MTMTLDMTLNQTKPRHESRPDDPRDATTAMEARAQLQAHPYRGLNCVRCQCRARLLTLSGVVESYYMKQLAQTIVADIDGVEAVQNRIEVCRPTRGGES